MKTIFQAALAYFGIVFGTGFVLGSIRVPFLVPRLGERKAELMEMPLMLLAIFFAARYVLRRWPDTAGSGKALAIGSLALVLLVVTECGMALAMQDQSIVEYVSHRDPVSGSVYLVMLALFALMPWFVARRR